MFTNRQTFVVWVVVWATVAGARPAGADVIGVDNVQGPDSTWWLAIGRRYDELQGEIESAGHSIRPLNAFGSDSLQGLRAVVLHHPSQRHYPPAELVAITEFVDRGGGLVVMAEGGAGSAEALGNLNALVARYGVSFAGGEATEGTGHVIQGFHPHPVTAGVTSVGIDYQRRQTIGAPAIDLTIGGGADDFLSVVNGVNGAGNVVLLSDVSLFSDDGPPTGSDYPIWYGSNRVLWRNIIGFVVPEPSVFAGLLVALVPIGLRRRRR